VITSESIKNSELLLVDNDLVNILALKNILESCQFAHISHVIPASTQQYFSANKLPSLIVLNVDNTSADGFGVLKKLKQEMGLNKIPILLVTENVESEYLREALQLGGKEILVLPFKAPEVVSRVTNMLENYFLSNRHLESDQKSISKSHEHLKVIELTRELGKKISSVEGQKANYDTLTGLANTSGLRIHLDSVLNNIREDDRIVALLLFSLENFGDVTKSLGYDSGDEILKIAASRITDSVRKIAGSSDYLDNYFIAKYSGGKFAIILNDLQSETMAISIGHRILATMTLPFELPEMVLDIGIQVGVSLAPRFTCSATELLRQSDVALYAAKAISQPLIVYEKDIDRYDARRLALMADLRKAINEDSLYLVYQPKINVKTGEISGVEALLRWNHPELGLIPPNEFIPLAEKSSVIKPLTVWVLNNAMRQASAFAQSGLNISMAVNISACSLRDDSIVGYTKMLLQKNNVAADRLTMEITESAMMQDPNMALSLLKQLSLLGVQISIDDYGTGYSSLAYLKRMPVNEMKIDRTFIKDMAFDEDDRLIVGTTINMGHNFGLRVVAEGVEDRETIDILRKMGVDKVQGFYYAMPMPIDELYDWMTVDNKAAWSLR